MPGLRDDLKLALGTVPFARRCGIQRPDPWQRELLDCTSKRIIINCSRQSGKSTMAAVLALHRALYHPSSLVLCLAPALRQSQELFAKISEFYGALGEPMKAFGERRLSLELTNRSRIVTLPGTEKTIRGYSGVSLLIVDEASRVEDSLYYAIRPMLSVSGGALMMLSTPNGRRGVFFEEWTNGTGWRHFEIPGTEVPRISPGFLEEERRSLPERVYRQEYCCQFLGTDDQVFHDHIIEDAFVDDPPLWGDFSTTGVAEYVLDDEGQWRSAEDLMLGKQKRSLADIEKAMERAIILGGVGVDVEKLMEEYEQAKNEQEALGYG